MAYRRHELKTKPEPAESRRFDGAGRLLPSSRISLRFTTRRRFLRLVGRRGESTGHQLGQQIAHHLAGDGVALRASGAGDVDADRLAVEIDQRAAAVGRLDDRIMLQDPGETAPAVTQGTAHGVLCTVEKGGPFLKLGLELQVLVAAS